jgi:hypothetical protein
MVAHGADNVPVPVVSLPIAEEIHRWVVSGFEVAYVLLSRVPLPLTN